MTSEYREVASLLLLLAALLACATLAVEWLAVRRFKAVPERQQHWFRIVRRSRGVVAVVICMFFGLSLVNNLLATVLATLVTVLAVSATQHVRLSSGRVSRALYGGFLPGLVLAISILNLQSISHEDLEGLQLETWVLVPAALTALSLWGGTKLRGPRARFRRRR